MKTFKYIAIILSWILGFSLYVNFLIGFFDKTISDETWLLVLIAALLLTIIIKMDLKDM